MDPQLPTGIDPKLKEAYDRVMSTTIPSPTQPPLSQVPTPQPSAQIAQPMPTPVSANPVPVSQSQTKAPIMFNAGSTKPATHSRVKILPILFVLGGIIFFVAYAVFWTKVFGLKVPFLPF